MAIVEANTCCTGVDSEFEVKIQGSTVGTLFLVAIESKGQFQVGNLEEFHGKTGIEGTVCLISREINPFVVLASGDRVF
jgi:hypothetical protein